MPSYKLYYFENKGAAEVPRQIFALAGQEYEDIRYKREDWPQHKAETPFGQLPVLEVDGKKLAQSLAITRYLARNFGFGGKTPFEQAYVDAVADQTRDFFSEVMPVFLVLAGYKEGNLEELEKSVLIPARDKHFPLLEKILKNNKTGFLVGESVTYADVILAHIIASLHEFFPNVFDNNETLNSHQKKIHSIPALAKWIETRPVTKF